MLAFEFIAAARTADAVRVKAFGKLPGRARRSNRMIDR
jgi:hypothetical protein